MKHRPLSTHQNVATLGIALSRPRTNEWRYLALLLVFVSGCAVTPPPAAPFAPGLPSAVSPAVPPVASPMTLPRFLGVESLFVGARRVIYRSRVRMSTLLPILHPLPAAGAPVALGDPCCLESPAPAVAAAASIQQAEAAAPAKVQAIGYLATMDLCKNPQVEEAFLAAMDDPSESVRIAAVQGIIDATERCGDCASGCNGCCTSALQQKLWKLAHDVNDQGCWCESSPKVRRLARIASCRCQPVEPLHLGEVPEELPSPLVLEQAKLPPSVNP